ncbi:PREDICTED: PI-PLC X domain-containing protein 3 isoform X2 [Dufourea novaeangliae]|uniref:PI-PLC X domain-containing protein 3 isoform X2 n=1 Tax=Dufourea novaeangliae TaxID=178035 RepID=UPI000767410E|nr:PREDICTED: PI-PLC X domain-containing protein 3 isoform X2 [Dufourea novaeangliae]
MFKIMEYESGVPYKVGRKGIISNEELEYWMTRLPEVIRNVPIIQLAIPGSHDTMTYTINRRNDVGPDEPNYIRALGRYCSLVSKPIIFNWSITQHDNIKDQLNGGIRYLDLRVATKPPNGNIYFVHGLFSTFLRVLGHGPPPPCGHDFPFISEKTMSNSLEL